MRYELLYAHQHANPLSGFAGKSTFSSVMSSARRFDQPSQDNMESGPGPPVDAAPDLRTPHLPRPSQRSHALAPQLPSLPLFPSLPPLSAVTQLAQLPPVPHPPQVPQIVEAPEVIDLTGLSDGDDGDDWEDVPEVVDLTNLPSSDEDEDHVDADADAELDDVSQNYTILNLPPRGYPLLNGPPNPPIPALTRSQKRAAKREAKRAARAAGQVQVPPRVPARVPVRRDICELCARVVRWGPGCLITKHHLYPQEITKKYPDRYTKAQKGSLALLCRPCHDACHRAHSNRTLADFYNEVDLLKADPNIQAHISSMQRATTPELIARHGDGVNVRGRKEQVRLARSNPQRKLVLREALSRYNLRQKALPGPPPAAQPAPPPPAAAAPPPPPPGVRRSARLLAKNMGEQPRVPVIVIDDEDEHMQDAAIHEDPREEENDGVQDIVNEAELAILEGLGEYIRL